MLRSTDILHEPKRWRVRLALGVILGLFVFARPCWAASCISDHELEAAIGDEVRGGAFAVRTDQLGERPLCSGATMAQAVQAMRKKLQPQIMEQRVSQGLSQAAGDAREPYPSAPSRAMNDAAKPYLASLRRQLLGGWDVTELNETDPGRCTSTKSQVENQYMSFLANGRYEFIGQDGGERGRWIAVGNRITLTSGSGSTQLRVKIISPDFMLVTYDVKNGGSQRFRRCKA